MYQGQGHEDREGHEANREMLDDQIVAAWREAASRFGIRVIAPHVIELSDGTFLEVEAFLPDFGGPAGVAAVAFDNKERIRRITLAQCFCSLLAPSYRHFELKYFRDTLNDWRWYGSDDNRPDWYTGKPWSA